MKRNKIILSLLIISIVLNLGITFNLNNYINAYNLHNPYWDLVDSGKHIDYIINSKYSANFTSAVSTWNNINFVIRRDTWYRIKDLNVYDYNGGDDGGIAWASSTGYIKFNDYYMVNLSSNQKTSVAMHELGHALGIGHNNTDGSIMQVPGSFVTVLAQDDINAFNWLYNHKY